MSADPIPAVVEAEATGATAATFADLRASLGVPFVNLIWRHLATIPGGLDWTWSLLRPVYAAPELLHSAGAVADGIALPGLALPPCVLAAAGVSGADQAVIARLIADYNRGNGLNLLALSLAVRVLQGEAHPTAKAAPSHPTSAHPAPAAPFPPLPAIDVLALPLRTLVTELDQFGRLGLSTAVASLYRHLALWPGFLALAHTALLPLHRAGTLQDAQRALLQRVALRAGTLQPLLQAPEVALGEAERARVLAGLDEFTRLMIGRMVVMGHALLALLPDHSSGSVVNSSG